jgi:tyrosine-protein phosphatase YwqE
LVDIHSHVLYGLDDGARTLEDSLGMLRMAAEINPHYQNFHVHR